jgi:hypothetical protein
MKKSQLIKQLNSEFQSAKRDFQRLNSSRDEYWKIQAAAVKYLAIKRFISQVKSIDSLD